MSASHDPYRFGEFSFDPSSGDLDGGRAGAAVRLQPQVAALLTLLLDHAGSVVSRGEVRTRLWPDTTVEFDDGLNFCVRQLRVALGDDAAAPTYVETLPRRGYRFVAPVTRSGTELATPAPAGEPSTMPARSSWRVAGLGVAVAIIAAITVPYTGSRAARVSAVPRVSLAVLPFLADTADQMMAVYRRRLIDQVNGDARPEPAWQLVADTNAATYVLSGSLVRQGNSVRIFVQLVHRSDHRHLWADSILDSYAFSGNSTLTADRIERSVARLLGANGSAASASR